MLHTIDRTTAARLEFYANMAHSTTSLIALETTRYATLASATRLLLLELSLPEVDLGLAI